MKNKRPKLQYSNFHWVRENKVKKLELSLEELESISEPLLQEEEGVCREVVEKAVEIALPVPQDKPRRAFKPLEEHTVMELRGICRERGVPQAGSKEELINKIKNSIQ